MPLYYRYFNQPYTGNYIDYTFDIAPLNDFESVDYEIDQSVIRQGFDYLDSSIAFGFANIPTGILRLVDQDNEQGVAVLKEFPTGEFQDWLNNREYVPEYNEETGLLQSTLQDMLKTFVVDPSVSHEDLMKYTDFITIFTGVNSRIYDQDNNFVFSYSNKIQGPISIHGNIFKHHQNYSINSIPVNSKMSRGCSDKFHISGLFFTHPDFKFTVSARGHTCETPWTPAQINNKIWLSSTGLFSPGEEDVIGYRAQWMPEVSSGVYSEGAEEVFDLVSGNRMYSISRTPLMYSDKVTQDIHHFTKSTVCENTSYLQSNSISDLAFWRSENISFPLYDDGYPTRNIGIVMVVRISEEFEDYANFPFNDGWELMHFGSSGSSSSLSIELDEVNNNYYFKLKFKGGSQSEVSAPFIAKGDRDYHILHWTYDLYTTYTNGWKDTSFLGTDQISHGGAEFPTDSVLSFQRLQGIEIAEILIYNQVHVGSSIYYDKNKNYFIEGYLSHKFNLDVLSSSHPFYHGYPAILKAGLKGGVLEDLIDAKISNLLHF